MAVRVPVFLSYPSALNHPQQEIYDYICRTLEDEGLQPRALGRSDFPHSNPMTEVYYIARSCFGGIILGFSQFEFDSGTFRRGTPMEQATGAVRAATPWNQIEAGMLTALRRPLLYFAERNVEGGVFDQGASSGYLQRLDPGAFDDLAREQIRERIRIWSAEVRAAFRS